MVKRMAWAASCALTLWLAAFGLAAALSAEQRANALDAEFLRLLGAGSPTAASMSEQEIWRLWFLGPSDEATAQLAKATSALRNGDFLECETILDALIEAEPEFAEAWNQRAFARFLQLKLNDSLEDIERTLALEPRHFGALSGRARIEAQLGKPDDARRTMGEVGRIHPWLARASAIPPDPPPPAPVEQRDL